MAASIQRGRLITVEGIDGAGKSTHLPWLKELVERSGRQVWLTREPGGTPLGERLRELLLHESMAPLTEALLMFAARREHCEREIWPRLAAGTWVVCDRFTDATYAYQGAGHGLAVQQIADIDRIVMGGFSPDITFVLDVPPAVGKARLADGRTLDKFESEQAVFFERVRSSYLARAAAEPERCRVIDSTQSRERVRAAIEAVVLAAS
ncbi:MAG: dTMP kinase [Betaproteobacteria bacterium]|nr:MAG: dTMP kinase [Betaproteobacteria bacterium]